MRRLIILAIIAASLIAFLLAADLEAMSSAILSMSAESLLVLSLLMGLNELFKGLRWAHYLRSSQLDISIFDGATSYVASQAASALPGGTVLSARLAQEHGNVKMRQAAASLVGQGLGDAYALCAVATLSVLVTSQRTFQLIFPAVLVSVATFAVVMIRNRRVAERVMEWLKQWKVTRRFLPQEEDFREYTVRLMNLRTLGIGAGYSIATTLVSAAVLLTLGLSLTERGITASEAVYAHSFSTIARTVLPTPGGLGVSDASLAGLLNYIGIGLARATFVALAYRTTNMLFRTSFGVLVLFARYPHVLVGHLRVPLSRPAAIAHRGTNSRWLRFAGMGRSSTTATPVGSSNSSEPVVGTDDANSDSKPRQNSEKGHRGT